MPLNYVLGLLPCALFHLSAKIFSNSRLSRKLRAIETTVKTSANRKFWPERRLQSEDREDNDLRRHCDEQPDDDVRDRLHQ